MSKKLVLSAKLIIVLLSVFCAAHEILWVKATGAVYIRSDGSVYPSAPIQQNGDIYTLTGNIISGADGLVIERDNVTLDGADYMIQGAGVGIGVNLTNRSHITIKNVRIVKFETGIFLKNSYRNKLSGNDITYNRDGVWLYGSSGNSIFWNNVANNNLAGVYLLNSLGNSLFGNDITNNYSGIGLTEFSNNNTLFSNKIEKNNWAGISLTKTSNNNTLLANNITSNNWYGINLEMSSGNNMFGNNIINNNHKGINFEEALNNSLSRNNIINNDHGVSLYGASYNNMFGNTIKNNNVGISLIESSDNKIYHNNFIDNIYQVYDYSWDYYPDILPSINIWNDSYPSGGNYWSDYNELDLNHDGTGDSPYIIPQLMVPTESICYDYHPLMGIFTSFGISSGYHVDVVSNSTINNFDYFASNSTIEMYVSNMTATQMYGFCRICIPTELMNTTTISVIIDDGKTAVLYPNYTLYGNGSHIWIYFAYEHSTHKILIVPEFPSFIILPLSITATLFVLVICWRKNFV